MLVGCQSSPPPTSATQKIIYKTIPNAPGAVRHNRTSASTYSQLAHVPIIRSRDGIQDIRWTISKINGRSAQFFVNQPHLILQSTVQQVSGNTGCNAISGTYQLMGTLFKMKAIADHQSCDNALAQEADLMDALSRVQSLTLQGNTLNLLDVNREILVQLQRQ